MAISVLILAALCAASAAPPPELYPHAARLNPSDFYLDNPATAHYRQQHRQEENREEPPARLETLDPDSEVELIPGAQQPQQPPLQPPLVPNVPGFIPGNRVFIVHMPVPGVRPGTIGGYQPVYVVGAAPQGNVYPGYQTPLLNPSGQPMYPPGAAGAVSPTLLFGATAYNRALGPTYQEPNYLQIPAQQYDAVPKSLRLAQLVSLQRVQLPQQAEPGNENSANPPPKSANLKEESKVTSEEQSRHKNTPEGLIRN